MIHMYEYIDIVILFHFFYYNQQASFPISFRRKYISVWGYCYHNLDLILPCVTVLLSPISLRIPRITFQSIYFTPPSCVIRHHPHDKSRSRKFSTESAVAYYLSRIITERNRYCTFIYLHVIYPERAGRFSHCQESFSPRRAFVVACLGCMPSKKQRLQFPNASTIVGHETLQFPRHNENLV